MAKLSNLEMQEIANNKGISILNPEDYVNLSTPVKCKCAQGHEFEESVKTLRNKNFVCPKCLGEKVAYVKEPPVKNGYRIVAFDQATKDFGVSIFDEGKLVFFDTIHFSKGKELEQRLVEIGLTIEKICREWQPDLVMYEDIQLQNTTGSGLTTYKILSELMGVVKYILARNNVYGKSVLNKVWQAEFVIRGSDRVTQKANCIKKVKDLFDIDVDNDCADAILIGKYAAIQKYRPQVGKLF